MIIALRASESRCKSGSLARGGQNPAYRLTRLFSVSYGQFWRNCARTVTTIFALASLLTQVALAPMEAVHINLARVVHIFLGVATDL
jgi:hypothetical protein